MQEKVLINGMTISPINRCNLRCAMCNCWNNEINLHEIEAPFFEAFIDKLKPFMSESFEIGFTGGEPLLFKDLIKVLTYLTQNKIRKHIVTNGYLLNEKKVETLKKAGIDRVIVSLDSHLPFIHDKNRGVKGAFERAVSGIKLLKQYEIPVDILSILMNDTILKAPDMVAWVFSELPVERIQFNFIMHPLSTDFDEAWPEGKFSKLWPKDKEGSLAALDLLIAKKLIMGRRIINSAAQFIAFKNYFLNPAVFIKKGECTAYKNLLIHPHGVVTFCQKLETAAKQVNILDNITPEEIFYSENFLKLRQVIKKCDLNCHQLINCNFEE